MPYRCLADFVEELGHAGELTRVEEEVDPSLEAAEIATRTAHEGGNALLFGSVRGCNLPILCNLLATEGRIRRALGVGSLDEVAGRLARFLDVASPEGWFERLKSSHHPASLYNLAPREVKAAACQQVVRLGSDVRLGELPWLRCDAAETSPAIPAALVLSAEPDSHRPAAARFDLAWVDDARLAVCWAACDEHAGLVAEYRARNRKMPLAVVIGGDPAFLLATLAPLPSGGDPAAVAGLLREKPLDVVPCRTMDLRVPAEAEIVLEGFLDPDEPPVEVGPRLGPMGRSAAPRRAPAMHVAALTHRANPIQAVFLPGKPPHELSTAIRAMQRAFLPFTRLAMPDLVDYDMPECAAARHGAAVAIRKTYPGQGRRAAHAAWGLPATRFAKMLVIVDDDVNVREHESVMAAVATNFRPDRDVVREQGPADPFDPSPTSVTLGERMALDATRKLDGE